MVDNKEWHKIGDRLCSYLGICRCQRKLKSIIDNLWELKEKNEAVYQNGGNRDFTGAEWALLAMLDCRNLIDHGVNCEYPIIPDNEFWQWVEEVRTNPNLEDN